MKKIFFLVVVTVSIFSACNKTDNTLSSSVPLSEYNLQTPGKYIIYKLDSLTYPGGSRTVSSYFAKDIVDSTMIIDELGRPGYRIFHYIKKNESDDWQPANTFYTIPTRNTIELVINNLRYVKLAAPIVEGFSWKGNNFIDSKTTSQTVTMPGINDFDITYLADWDYIYTNVNQPATIGNFSFDSTITVDERDQVDGDTSDNASFSQVTYSVEQYAKGVGLVYRNFLYRVFQPTQGSQGEYQSNSYGITLTIIDHN